MSTPSHPSSLLSPCVPSKPENCDALSPPARAAAIANALLARRFLIRASRVYWKPRPGMERLAKWPKKLAMAPAPDRAAFSPARHTFYAWTFDRPSSPYAWVYSALVVTNVIILELNTYSNTIGNCTCKDFITVF